MTAKLAIIALPILLLSACAPMPPPAPAPPPPPVAAGPGNPPPAVASDTPIPIRSFTCADLLGAADDDRASAAMFFIGYRAALAHTRALTINEVEAIEETALSACAASPAMPANRAFAEALAANTR